MSKKDYVNIDKEVYKNVKNEMERMTTEELIKVHKSLIGKKIDYYEIEDCSVDFVRKLIDLDWGRTIAYKYSDDLNEFIQSKYLSDYIKTSIKELLSNEKLSNVVLNALNSDKLINDMTEKEIKSICLALKDFSNKREKEYAGKFFMPTTIASVFKPYIFKLDGEGIKSFIKNDIPKEELASRILDTSGLNPRSSYYSGRGVNRGDLNETMLVSIFEKLLKLDKNYANEFVEMVKKMKTLGATEFIDSFIIFVARGFDSKKFKPQDNNFSLNGVYGDARYSVAIASLFAAMSNSHDSVSQDYATREIKSAFIRNIELMMKKNDPDFKGYNYKDDYDSLKYFKKYKRW